MIYIGQDVMLTEAVDYCELNTEEVYHVQDTNALTLTSKIGKVDKNNLVFESWWIENKYLKAIN